MTLEIIIMIEMYVIYSNLFQINKISTYKDLYFWIGAYSIRIELNHHIKYLLRCLYNRICIQINLCLLFYFIIAPTLNFNSSNLIFVYKKRFEFVTFLTYLCLAHFIRHVCAIYTEMLKCNTIIYYTTAINITVYLTTNKTVCKKQNQYDE